MTCVQFFVRLQKLKLTPQPLSLRVASQQPYAMKEMRKVIDAAAFRVYAHWVKRGECHCSGHRCRHPVRAAAEMKLTSSSVANWPT